MYSTYINDEGRSHRENSPRPFGLRRKTTQALLSSLHVVPPHTADSASSGRFFPRNAVCPKAHNRF